MYQIVIGLVLFNKTAQTEKSSAANILGQVFKPPLRVSCLFGGHTQKHLKRGSGRPISISGRFCRNRECFVNFVSLCPATIKRSFTGQKRSLLFWLRPRPITCKQDFHAFLTRPNLSSHCTVLLVLIKGICWKGIYSQNFKQVIFKQASSTRKLFDKDASSGNPSLREALAG